jgi:hypothetical protein
MRILNAVRCISTAFMLFYDDYMLFDDGLSINNTAFHMLLCCFAYYGAFLFMCQCPNDNTAFINAFMLYGMEHEFISCFYRVI